MRAESIYIICDTHTVELYPNSVVHRGNRRTPRAVHEQERQRTYTSNIEARLRNHCCRGKANIVTHLECVCVCVCVCACVCVCVCSISYPARKTRAPYHIVTCGLPGCTIFFHFMRHDFRKKVIKRKMCF